jgi:hypothetical protein
LTFRPFQAPATAIHAGCLLLHLLPHQAPNLPDVNVHRRANRHAKHHVPAGRDTTVAEAIIATSGTEDAQYYDLNVTLSDSASCGDTASIGGDSVSSRTSRIDGVKSCFGKYGGLLLAMLMCQVGMILFNLGLTYGFAGGQG